MTTRVRVTDDWMLDKVAILVSPREGRILQWQVVEAEYDPSDGRQVDRDDPSVLALPESVARAIYEELGKHFGGGADHGALRKDYDAERKRVDTFIAHLTKDGRP